MIDNNMATKTLFFFCRKNVASSVLSPSVTVECRLKSRKHTDRTSIPPVTSISPDTAAVFL